MTETKQETPKKLSIAEYLEREKAKRLKRLQAQWKYEDESGETEAAIERWKFSREEE